MDFHRLKQTHIAEVLGVTPRAMRDWEDCPRNDDGTYDAPVVVQWYSMRDGPSGLNLDEQRARLAKAQADKTEMEIAVRGGELLEASKVIKEVSAMIGSCRARLIAIPDAVGQLFEPATARSVSAEVRRKLYEALAELSEYRPGLPPPDGESLGAAADSDPEPVGGRREKTQQRKQRRARPVENREG